MPHRPSQWKAAGCKGWSINVPLLQFGESPLLLKSLRRALFFSPEECVKEVAKKERKKERKKKGEERKKKKEKSTMALRWLLRVERSFFPGCAIVSSLSPFFFFFFNFLNSILPCFRYFLTPLLRRRCIHKRTLLRVASTRWYWWGKLNWETPYLLVFVNVQNCFV